MEKFTNRVTALEDQMAKKADKTEVEAIKEKVNKMEKNEQPQVDAIAKMEEKLTEFRRDCEEIEKRRTNIIIYKVTESVKAESKARKEDDEAHFKATLVKLSLPEMTVKAVARLGSRNEGRERPIKLVQGSEAEKEMVLNRVQELRRSDKPEDIAIVESIQIAPDFTLRQRTERKTLIQQLEHKKQEGEEDLVIKGNSIVKKNPFHVRRKSETETH